MRYMEIFEIETIDTARTDYRPGPYVDATNHLWFVPFEGAMPVLEGSLANYPIRTLEEKSAQTGGLNTEDVQKLLATVLRPDLVLK